MILSDTDSVICRLSHSQTVRSQTINCAKDLTSLKALTLLCFGTFPVTHNRLAYNHMANDTRMLIRVASSFCSPPSCNHDNDRLGQQLSVYIIRPHTRVGIQLKYQCIYFVILVQDSNKVGFHHHHHQSLNREGRWGTTDDFATSFLHFSLFSTALWDLPNSRPVHSLMLSSHLFLCLPCLLPPFTVPCKMVLARPDERET